MNLRHLTPIEIKELEQDRHCTAENWGLVEVADSFAPGQLTEVTFIGRCRLGDLSGSRTDRFGIDRPCGIRRALLRDTTIGDGAFIANIRDCISRYDIGDRVTITNTDAIVMSGSSTFGCGQLISVLNETGGIEVPLSRGLTAQIAYLLVTLPKESAARCALLRLISEETERCRSDRGTIGDDVRIVNSGTLTDGFIGQGSVIEGASRLADFSLCSKADYPTRIGIGVIGEYFIAAAGASMLDNCTVHKAFVGQSARISNLFSLNESLIFSNCSLENGEATAIVGGPFTVSMHKSSLLIAGYFSFLNAGSGSNQSNHLYKTGPIHFGVVERGSKTASDSYILWPSKIGPFSLITGRHKDHVDTSDFPFSYVIENHDDTYLVPARALMTIGTMRDAKKWSSRDHRPPDCKLDCINYNLLSPYTVGKMEVGHRRLSELLDFVGAHDETYIYHNLHVRSTALRHGLEIYGYGMDKFVGNSLITRIRDKAGEAPVTDIELLRSYLQPDHSEGEGRWLDLCGMIAPKQSIDRLLEQTIRGDYATLQDFSRAVRRIHERYYDLEWDWSFALLCRRYGITGVEEVTGTLLGEILHCWIDAVLTIDRQLLRDAEKEYAIAQRITLDDETAGEVTGHPSYEEDPYVLCVREHIERKQQLYQSITDQLRALIP